MSELNLEIISAQGIVFKGACSMAVVPSVDGDIGVMFGHESFIAKLREGKISIYDDKQNLVKDLDVTDAGGFAEINSGDKLLVLIN